MDNKITVLLPTLNEANSVRRVIEETRALPIPTEIIVIDGRSRDETVAIAQNMGVKVLLEHKKGKGIAVRRGLKEVKTPVVVMIDADGTYPVDQIPNLLNNIGQYDIVKGNRSWHANGAMTKTHRFGNWALSIIASVLYNRQVKDVCSGMWAIKMSKVRKFNLTSEDFTFEADLFINSVKNKCSFKEIPISYSKRIQGDKAKLMLSDGFKIGWFLLKKKIHNTQDTVHT